jgi:hypothetical protein
MEDPWREKSSSILKFDSVPPDFPAGRLWTRPRSHCSPCQIQVVGEENRRGKHHRRRNVACKKQSLGLTEPLSVPCLAHCRSMLSPVRAWECVDTRYRPVWRRFHGHGPVDEVWDVPVSVLMLCPGLRGPALPCEYCVVWRSIQACVLGRVRAACD